MAAWNKIDIIHFLSDLYGYRSYLELCSSTTGNCYHQIDKSKFKTCHRLMYRTPSSFDDGLDINFRSAHVGTKDLLETIHAFGLRYDIILVDSFHTLGPSYRDLVDAFGIVSDHGTIVVHDCLPPTEELVAPEMIPGSWCGVTFAAFIDFVLENPGLKYLTIDTDYGCGIIRKSTAPSPAGRKDIADGWRSARHDFKAAYRYMMQHKVPLLNLVTIEEFKRRSEQRPS